MGLNPFSIQTNDKYRFVFEGWWIGDIESEIRYWEEAMDNPDEYDTNVEYCEEQVVQYKVLLERAEKAYEAQRTDKVDYNDGTWV